MGVLVGRLCQSSISARLVGVLVQVLFVLSAMATASADDDVVLTKSEEAALKVITEGTNKFAINLYKELIKDNRGNVFVSPLSAQMVLALAYTGAGSDTASELKSLLSLPDNLDQTHSGYHSLIKSLKDPVLHLANRMFVEKTTGVKADFQSNAEKYFLAPAELVDFKLSPAKCTDLINVWVENQTNHKIKDIIQKGVIHESTRLLLVNAIHFKADWKVQFNKDQTVVEPFHTSKTETKQVKMMHKKATFGFAKSEALNSKILEMEYKGMNFRMIIILPDKIDGLAELEAKLDTVDLFDELNQLEYPQVDVKLPSFKLEQTMELSDILKAMGVKTMFSDKADFSKMAAEKLVVDSVIQKAFVEVNEKGTEAAAATVVIGSMATAYKLDDQYFLADRPFLFVILGKSGSYDVSVFVGRFTDPE